MNENKMPNFESIEELTEFFDTQGMGIGFQGVDIVNYGAW